MFKNILSTSPYDWDSDHVSVNRLHNIFVINRKDMFFVVDVFVNDRFSSYTESPEMISAQTKEVGYNLYHLARVKYYEGTS